MKPIDRGTWLALIAMGIAVFVIANDFSAINVAIPQIEHDFKTDVTTAQWVVNAYALVFGVLIVTGGRLADIFGRRRAFFIGTTIFATFSALGGAAQTEAELIAMRALMGIGGALMWPAILGMTYAALPEERAGLAGGFILGAAGIGNAAGPLIGGALTDLLSWRWIFFLNVPVSAFAIFVTWREIHQPRPKVEDRRMDYAGIVTVTVGLVSLLIAFDQVIDWGWGDPRIIALLALFSDPDLEFRIRRAPRRGARVRPARRDQQPRLRLHLRGDPADVGRLLRVDALPAAAHDQRPWLLGDRRGRRHAADDGDLRRRLLRGGKPLQPLRIQAAPDSRLGLHRHRSGPGRAARRQGDIRCSGPGHGDPRTRDRALLPDRDHRRGDERATSRDAASPARSSTCSRSPAAPSASA